MIDILRIDGRPPGRARLAAVLVGLLGLAGCQTAPQPPQYLPRPLASGSTRPLAVAASEAVAYAVLADRSDIRFLVYRAGPLAGLGHNHVVRARNASGEIRLAADLRQSSFLIEIPVNDFQVDEPDARREEGEAFLPLPDDDAIAGTTRNMLGDKVLDAQRFPTIAIESAGLSGPSWGPDIALKIRMHGVERQIVVPVAIERSDDTLVVTAFFSINQSDFDIVPMAVLGGGLQVRDAVQVRLRIVAAKSGAPR